MQRPSHRAWCLVYMITWLVFNLSEAAVCAPAVHQRCCSHCAKRSHFEFAVCFLVNELSNLNGGQKTLKLKAVEQLHDVRKCDILKENRTLNTW